MKLTTLRALVAAIEEGSLRSAARRVGVSQPALTKMIRELELELSTTLFVQIQRVCFDQSRNLLNRSAGGSQFQRSVTPAPGSL